MGVPRFFWWFLHKYPKTLSDAGADFDNFYIDLNDIIHRSFRRPHDLFQPSSYDEIVWILYQHIDRLVHIVKPRKLLFIAIDGVASRAKMYPIRSGRASVAMSYDLAAGIEQKLRQEFEKEGKSLLSEEDTQGLDSSVVTPGTTFMQKLSQKLRSYICQRMSEEYSAWGNIKVILSDDKVPGEGEHKIMSFIRAQRALPGYDPNTRHCVYGTDTDIIMLALATHELHFSILRELEVIGYISNREGIINISNKLIMPPEPIRGVVELKFLNVCVLREYLALDLKIPCSDKLEYDLERIIDDFIFICFFAGNDFLPRISSLQTHEGCIDLLIHVYKKEFQNFGGYLVDMQKAEDGTGGYINFKGVERFILTVGAYEDKIFSRRSQLKNRKSRPPLEDSRKDKDNEKDHQDDGRVSRVLTKYAIVDTVDGIFRNTVELLLKVADEYDLLPDVPETDKVKYGTHGWRERYYKEKFSAETPEDIEATRKIQVAKYGEGLCWVLLCYFSGVPSWSWYPYCYAPLASDMQGLSQTKVEFQRGLPFKPFDQLVAVLPPSRAYLLPEAYQRLMIDKNSKIAYLNSKELNEGGGKSRPWRDMKHPCIDEDLLSETEKLENQLTDHERIRNSETLAMLFVKRKQIVGCCGGRAASNKIKGAVMMNSPIEGIQGVVHLMPEDLIDIVDDDDDDKRGCSRNVLCMFYETNQDYQHVPQLLKGVNIPQKTVKEEDRVENILWHEVGRDKYQNRRQFRADQDQYSQGASDGGRTYAADHTMSSLGPNYGNRHHQSSEYNTRRSRKDGYGGTGSHREPESSFWRSRSNVTYDSNDDWRANKQSAAVRSARPNESSSSSGRW